jgi:cation diffusion facilitator family transporter
MKRDEAWKTAALALAAAIFLVALKLAFGFASGSLGLIAEGLQSTADAVAAAATLFALRIAGRPADAEHPFGHGKAENLAALGEASFLLVSTGVIASQAITRLTADTTPHVDASLGLIAVLVVVLVVDASRALTTTRAARRFHSAALGASAAHFVSDFGGTLVVLAGIAAVRGGHPAADAWAALVVAAITGLVAVRLVRSNVGTLMDETSSRRTALIRTAVERGAPDASLLRVRVREVGLAVIGDVTIGVAPESALVRGHWLADRVEEIVEELIPGSDVVVHVEPLQAGSSPRERATVAALGVSNVREIHNVLVLEVRGGVEVSLHMKLAGTLPLAEAHRVASQVEAAIEEAVPEARKVQTHIEPLDEVVLASGDEGARVERIARAIQVATGSAPLSVDLRVTEAGAVAYATIVLPEGLSVAEAHRRASAAEVAVHREVPEVLELVLHTEPA